MAAAAPPAVKPPSAFPSEVVPGFLYLGSYDHASRHEILKTFGMTHILNVRRNMCSLAARRCIRPLHASSLSGQPPAAASFEAGSDVCDVCFMFPACCRRRCPPAKRCTRIHSPTTQSLPARRRLTNATVS
jgi:hypothetical protein